MKNLLRSVLLVVLAALVCNTLQAQNQITGTDNCSNQDNCCSYTPKVNVKLNGLLLIGVVNPAVEFRISPKSTVQLEAFGTFWREDFFNTDKPLMMGNAFLEYRYYFKEAFRGFYIGPNVGYGIWKLTRKLVPGFGSEHETTFQVGWNVIGGASLGYGFKFGQKKQWGLDLNWALGGHYSRWDSWNTQSKLPSKTTKDSAVNFLPLYKGGIFLTYNF